MATLTDYLDYYQGRMAFQYANLPRASANIRNYVAQAVASNFLPEINSAFDLSTAVGPQLETIGKYIGVPRNVSTTLTTPYFGFWDYTESDPEEQNPNGFYDYNYGPDGGAETYDVPALSTRTVSGTVYFSSSVVDGDLVVDGDFIQSEFFWPYAEFYSYLNPSTENTALSDGQYRFLLQLQIFINHSNLSLASIQNFLSTYFPTSITVVDNTDMTLTYTVSPSVLLPVDVLALYLPRPMGVGLTIVEL